MARRMNFLGSALKVITGTPNASDFEKVNNITDTIDEIIKARKNELVDTLRLSETLLTRNINLNKQDFKLDFHNYIS